MREVDFCRTLDSMMQSAHFPLAAYLQPGLPRTGLNTSGQWGRIEAAVRKNPALAICDSIVDANRNVHVAGAGYAPCVTPCGLLYSLRRQRLLFGDEMLALQGVLRADLPILNAGGFSSTFLSRLAGNSFTAQAVGTEIIAASVHSQFSPGIPLRAPRSLPCGVEASPLSSLSIRVRGASISAAAALLPHQEFARQVFVPPSAVRRAIIDYPTGSGKTRTMLLLLESFYAEGRAKILVFPRPEVCRKRFASADPPISGHPARAVLIKLSARPVSSCGW